MVPPQLAGRVIGDSATLAARFFWLDGIHPFLPDTYPGKHARSGEPEKEEAGATSRCALVSTAGICSSAAQRRVSVCLLQPRWETWSSIRNRKAREVLNSFASDRTWK